MSVNSTLSAQGVEAVTPDDSANLGKTARALWIGTGGDVAVLCPDGTSATLTNVADGQLLSVTCIRVLATGTTASGIVALR